ncbi:LOW QUALITY PROTEIN: hypothetical protein Cgig2_022608 [Carnegiea gigantea]|uniref:Uncharacterized protein n=1 Tax=Carnegiea gigantea TaxID=171969 RepID=A0A9Q1JIJ7_9CARY|nr:LOW QUALITY PROTEIN: hypothetical protein Cgig2_022608 [Carnegiea gigantea]
MVLDQAKSVTKKDHSMLSYSLGLGLNSQSPVPHNTSVPDPSTAMINEDDGIEDDDDSTPFRIPLRSTSQVNCELNVKKPSDKKPKEGDKPASKKGEQQTTSSKVPHNAKELAGQRKQTLSLEAERKQPHAEKTNSIRGSRPLDALKKRQPENLPLAYCSSYVIRLTKLDSKFSQDELTISKYVFSKVEDMDNSELLFDGYDDKKTTRASMVTLRPGERVEMNSINIWSSILNGQGRKRDLASPSRLFMSCDQSVSAS